MQRKHKKLNKIMYLSQKILKSFSKYQGLNGLDRRVFKYISPPDSGIFLEAGANNGISQSNTYYLEFKKKWKGILVEPVPHLAISCKDNRPNSKVYNLALVSPKESGKQVELYDLDLMSVVDRPDSIEQAQEFTIKSAEEVQGIKRSKVRVLGKTLSEVISDAGEPKIWFFSLDVEGFEIEVLEGLDFSKHLPNWILIETKKIEEIVNILSNYYDLEKQFSHHDYLFKAKRT